MSEKSLRRQRTKRADCARAPFLILTLGGFDPYYLASPGAAFRSL
jgi:hypothetical protein